MAQPITKSVINALISEINTLQGNEAWTYDYLELSSASWGGKNYTVTKNGGSVNVSTVGRMTAREVYIFLQGMRACSGK